MRRDLRDVAAVIDEVLRHEVLYCRAPRTAACRLGDVGIGIRLMLRHCPDADFAGTGHEILASATKCARPFWDLYFVVARVIAPLLGGGQHGHCEQLRAGVAVGDAPASIISGCT